MEGPAKMMRSLPIVIAIAALLAGCAAPNMTAEQAAMAREVLLMPASVEVLRSTEEPTRTMIRVDGLIGPLMVDDFDRAVALAERENRSGKPIAVQLASRGGALNTSILLGRRIRAEGFETVIREGEVCFSACTIMWLSGSQKWIHRDGAVGFHEPIPATLDGSIAEARALVTDYLTSIGYSSAFADHMMSVPFDSALALTAQDNERFGLGVRVYGVDSRALPDGALTP
jgi:hypothetical protein